MADKATPGMEFASWTSLPSISDKIAEVMTGGQKNPLLMAAGKLIEHFNSPDQAPAGSVPSPTGMGQGLTYPNKQGLDPNAIPVGIGTPDYRLPMQQPLQTSLPSLSQPTTQPTDSYTKYLFAPR
jgi:hypothetical protein